MRNDERASRHFLSVHHSSFCLHPFQAAAALDFPHLGCQFIGGFPLFSPTKEGPKCFIKPKPNRSAGALSRCLMIGVIGSCFSGAPRLRCARDFKRLFSKCSMKKSEITCAQSPCSAGTELRTRAVGSIRPT